MTGRFLTACALLLFSSWLLVAPTGAHAAVRAVPGEYSSIADAFEACRSGDRVEVAPGVYTENHLVLPNGVALVGTGSGPADVTIDGAGRGRILLAEGLDESTLVANITFINGRASGHISYERSGGAIFCSNSTLRITNCVFLDNLSDGHGGAIRCNNSTPLITGCVFVGNAANSGGGGAIDCSFDSSPLIRGCEFRENTAAWGGALSCRGYSSPVVTASYFASNEAVGSKGYGGAIFADFGSTPLFSQSTIVNNSARYGGALACFSNAETNLENCTVTGNSALVLGGGLFAYDSSPHIIGSIIAFQEGTGITAEGGATPVINCTDIFGNSRGDWVGSIAAQLSIGDNLTADPLFCTSDASGEKAYGLNEDSPCASTDLACGYMGAWPIGCNTTGMMITTFTVQWESRHAHLAWQARTLSGPELQMRLTGSRDSDPTVEWEVTAQSLGGGYFEATDTNIDENNGGTYTYRLYVAESDDNWTLLDKVTLTAVPSYSGIRDLKAWPNPFNPVTTISFHLGQPQRARISVYSPTGHRIAVLADQEFGAGLQSQTWDGKDDQGNGVSSGTYIVLVEGSAEKKTRKITLLK